MGSSAHKNYRKYNISTRIADVTLRENIGFVLKSQFQLLPLEANILVQGVRDYLSFNIGR